MEEVVHLSKDKDQSNAKKEEYFRTEDIWYPFVITALQSPEGMKYLDKSHHDSYLILKNHFESQKTGSFCGIASAAIVLNSLFGVDSKLQELTSHNNQFTQDALHDFVKQFLVPEDPRMSYGLTLLQVVFMLEQYGVSTIVRMHSDPKILGKQLREDLLNFIINFKKEEETFIICNYWRQLTGHRGGHISPICGYEPESDQLLVLDVNTSRFPHHWIPFKHLVSLMYKIDPAQGKPRGYVIVSKKIVNV